MTVGQAWRRKRNLVIVGIHRALKVPQRMLGDVFDLPHSSIGKILETERSTENLSDDEFGTWIQAEFRKIGQARR